MRSRIPNISANEVAKLIIYLRALDPTHVVAFCKNIEEYLQHSASPVCFIVFDSLSFLFRSPSLSSIERANIMLLVQQTMQIATEAYGCAVVMTNQLATKLLTADNKPANFETGDRAVLMPQLGDSWTTPKTIRLALFRSPDDGLRYAYVSRGSDTVKSTHPWSSFRVNEVGAACDIEMAMVMVQI